MAASATVLGRQIFATTADLTFPAHPITGIRSCTTRLFALSALTTLEQLPDLRTQILGDLDIRARVAPTRFRILVSRPNELDF